MKILVIGHKQHGKDTVCEMLAKYAGYTWASSSAVANEEAVFPVLAPKYGYDTLEQCFEDRDNHREEWYQAIKAYNTPDKTWLARKIFEKADIYCGLRDDEEYEAIMQAGLVDAVIWVDASQRKPRESKASFPLQGKVRADYWIGNNGTEEDLEVRIKYLLLDLAIDEIEKPEDSGI